MERIHKMKKQILIIEDHPKWMETICQIAEAVSYETKLYKASNLKDAYQIAMEANIDLFIIDIILDTRETGDTSGIAFADNIRHHSKYQYTPIIFITSLEDPKLKAYSNIHCYSYIEKPFDRQRTIGIIEEALAIPLEKCHKEDIYFRKDGILHGFRVEDITHIVVKAHTTTVYCRQETAKVAYCSIKHLLEKEELHSFVRCNKSTIINRKHIKYIDPVNLYVKLHNVETRIEIGVIIKKEFLEEIEND